MFLQDPLESLHLRVDDQRELSVLDDDSILFRLSIIRQLIRDPIVDISWLHHHLDEVNVLRELNVHWFGVEVGEVDDPLREQFLSE